MEIRVTRPEDASAVWAILEPVIRAGETHAPPRDMGRAEAVAYWMGADRETFVTEEGGRQLDAYSPRANQFGGGAQVANRGYMTSAEAMGRGVARMMRAHSLERAQARGIRAMQFNFVGGTNERAARFWRTFGFETVGAPPLAFNHRKPGYVDALVMYKTL